MSLVGQVLDIIGSLLLFRFSFPPLTPTFSYETQQGGANPTEEEKNHHNKFRKRASWGAWLIAAGFAVQAVPTIIKLIH